MKGKKPQKYANIHQQFKPLPPAPLKKLNGVKQTNFQPGKELPYMQLEKVIGISSRNNNSMAVNPVNGDVAYPSGCIICIYSPKENKQTKFLFSRSQRAFSCLTYSQTGRYLAAGEGAFRQPEITIWEIQLDGTYDEIKHLKGHKYGIESIMFSPNLQYLISLGDANDRGLFVWDWDLEQRVTSNKLGKPVNTFAFSETGEFFVTAGYQHLKYWYFDENGKVQKTETNSKESIMESKSADLAKVRVKVFVGVACRLGQVFALASDGHLWVYDKNRKLTKWMNIKVDKAVSCTMTNDHLFCGCSDGIIRVFGTKSLEHILTLPKPPPLGSANIESGIKKIRIPATKDSRFADTLAVIVDEVNFRVVVLYSDRMIFIWDIKQLEKISVYRTALSHCGPIHDIQYVPNNMGDIGYQDEQAAVSLQEEQALTRFVTCSSDRTLRFWQFIDPTASAQTQQTINKGLVKNAYCKDMSRMVYVNSENRDQTVPQFEHFKMRPVKHQEDGQIIDQATLSPDDKDIEQQLRCVRISPDGKHVACGDWTGNIRVHDMKTFEEIQCIQAHDSEVVCLDYSPLIELSQGGGNTSANNQSDLSNPQSVTPTAPQFKYWLASGSRDRLTQIYEVSSDFRTYDNVTILEDHSSTLTSLKFAEERSIKGQKRLKLISCGADKQIVLRNVDMQIVEQNDVKKLQEKKTEDFIVVQKKEQCKYKTFAMDIAQQAGYIVTGHDKFLQLWQLSTCDKVWEKKPDSSRKSGSMDQIKVTIDPNAGVVLSSCTDKFVTVYEAATGNVLCRTTCGEITTGLCLSTNLKHLITTSADGIIYVWRMPEQVSKALQKLKQEQRLKEEEQLLANQPQQQQQLPLLLKQESDEFNDLENFDKGNAGGGGKQQEAVRISEVMAQINKATGQIDKIQPTRGHANKNANTEVQSDEEEFDFGGSAEKNSQSLIPENDQKQRELSEDVRNKNNPQPDLEASSATNSAHRKNRNNWNTNNNTKDPFHQFDSQKQQPEEGGGESDDSTIRQLKVKENKLPRWAQSVSGGENILDQVDRVTSNIRQSKYDEEKQRALQKDQETLQQNEDFEDIFKNTLAQQEQQPSHSKAISSQGGVPKNTFYDRIEEDLDEDKKSNEGNEGGGQPGEEDEDEKLINEQLKRRQLYRSRIVLGIEDEEGDGGVSESISQARRLRMRQNENRTSLSQQFFQRKGMMGASSESNLFRGQNSNELINIQNTFTKQQQQPVAQKDQQALKVEDLFNDDEEDDSQSKVKQNAAQSKVLQSSQSQFINNTPQTLRPQGYHPPQTDKKQTYTILSHKPAKKIDLDSQGAADNSSDSPVRTNPLQQQDLKQLVQDKYDQHKKLIEQEYSLKQEQVVESNKSQLQNNQQIKKGEIKKKSQSEAQKTTTTEQINSNDNRQKQFLNVKTNANEAGKSLSRSGSRQRYQNEMDDENPLIEESSNIEIGSVKKQSKGVNRVDEAAINATIKAEMDKINNSLAVITQSLNSIGGGIQGGLTSQSSAIRVKDDVTDSLSRSLGLWNSMIMTLGNRTSINMNLLQQSQQMSSISMSQSTGGVVGVGSSLNQSYLSQVSVKEDARDLIKQYSELLIEEISKKLSGKQNL